MNVFIIKKKTSENNVDKNEESVKEQKEEQPYKEVVVGAPLHLDHEHNSPQGLHKFKGWK